MGLAPAAQRKPMAGATVIRNNENLKAIDELKREAAKEIRASWGDMIQVDISRITGLHQGEVSDIMVGRLLRFSLSKLIIILVVMGRKTTIRVEPLT